MDKIFVEDLEVYGYHGVNPEEKAMGQRFLISMELILNLGKAGSSDDLNETVNYAELCHSVEEEFKKNKYNLIEKAAEELCKYILERYEIVKKIKLSIKKPWAPIGKPLKYAGIEIEREWHIVYIALGSNMGDKENNIRKAIEAINDLENTRTLKTSSLYETKPVGYLDQDNFLNCVIEIKTLLSEEKLLTSLLDIEKNLKRERIIKWGPRTIDLDIIFYDNIITSSEDIVIPHLRMHERLFVLKPLCEIAPYIVHPLLNKRVVDLMEELSKVQEI